LLRAGGRGVGAHRDIAFALQEQRGDKRQTGAADEHQMCWAPERDVLTEDPVPDVVEWKADERVQPATGHQHAADGRVPGLGDLDGGRTGLVIRQDDRQRARDEQQEQTDQDEVVRRVGQRAGVAALADVQADVPDEAEHRADDRRDEQQRRQGDPAGPVHLAAGLVGQVLQPGDAALPVQIADPQQAGGDDAGCDGHPENLVEGGAPAFGSGRGHHGDLLGELCCHVPPHYVDEP